MWRRICRSALVLRATVANLDEGKFGKLAGIAEKSLKYSMRK
jgi:hypothetical protein